MIKLPRNWNISAYDRGNGYEHIALGIANGHAACDALAAKGAPIIRPAGPMSNAFPYRDDIEVIALIEGPGGYRV